MSGMDIGRDGCSAVSGEYQAPFAFEGLFHQLTIDITDDLSPAEIVAQDTQRIRRELAQQ